MLGKAEQLFQIFTRLIPALQINDEACAAACSSEIYAAREACRLAAKEMPFRDAYATVAQRLKDGSFVVANETGVAIDLGLEKSGAELTKSEAWICDRRSFLVTTTERLFDWK